MCNQAQFFVRGESLLSALATDVNESERSISDFFVVKWICVLVGR